MKPLKTIKAGLLILLIPFLCCLCRKTNTTLSEDAVAVFSISPDSGNANTLVTLKGKGFSLILTEDTVRFNGTIASVNQTTDTTMQVVAPSGAGTGNISVAVRNEQVGGPVFTYLGLAPVITNVVFNGLFGITGQHFDPVASIVMIGGQVVPGFTYSDNGNGQDNLTKQSFIPANDLPNPAPVTVTVNNIVSNIYSFLFYPQINSVNPDTVSSTENASVAGLLFGDRSVASSVRAFYYDQGQNKEYMSPDPTIVSWNTNTIQVTFPDYGGYPVGTGSTAFYLEITVGSKSTIVAVYFHIT